jgi:heme/copper-type cytochrome/quinol oxidase subunit 2
VSVLVPVVGVVLNWSVLKTSAKDTNANTCAMIGIVLAWIVTIIGLVVMGLYLLLLWAYSGHRHYG